MKKQLTLGSLCDGIGGWLLAAVHNGVKPIWCSEIDEAPARVTAKWFPEVKQLGDLTKINTDEIEIPNIVCAGTPCQDLSIAGKRAGLSGERSGLFRNAVELVYRLRARAGGEALRYFVWENVPGAFTSGNTRGADFRAVLEEIGQSSIPMPPNGRWANAGMVVLPSCRIEWRLLDAQYWGVPQRRKRIFLVADFAAPQRGGREILFEQPRSEGHSSESRGSGQGTAAEAGSSSQSAGTLLGEHHKDNPLVTDGRSVRCFSS